MLRKPEAGIAEYWIVEPQEKRITVLKLEGRSYVPAGEYALGQRAVSELLTGFGVDVDAVLAAARPGSSSS